MSIILLFEILLSSLPLSANFLTEQKKFARVRSAIEDKHEFLITKLQENKISPDNLQLLFVAYKDNDLLDIYAKNKQESIF